ncbi:MAG: ABC transporter [Chloroflexi bacterium]|nr:ABC transporter [Chloroflexota bacterium]
MVRLSSEKETQSPDRITRRIAYCFRPYFFQVVFVGALICVTAGIGVVNPLLIQVVFDHAIFPSSGTPNLNLLWLLGVVMASVSIVTGVLGISQSFLTIRMGQRVMRDIRDQLYQHLQSLSMGFFTDTRTGEIQSRVADDVGGVQKVVTTTISDVISNSVIFVSTLIAMLILSWELTLVAVGTTPFFFLISRVVGRRRKAVAAETQKVTAEVTAITQETLSISGILLSKLFGRQNQEIARFHTENQKLSDLIIRQYMTGQWFFAVMQIFFSISPVMIYVLAGYLIYGLGPSAISAGTVVAFTTLQSRLYFPIGRLLEVSVELQASLALFERIFSYLDIESDISDDKDAIDLAPEMVSGKVAFEDVRINYGSKYLAKVGSHNLDDERWALDGVSFEIKPGQLAAFVGPTGAGKTTLSYLIPRLYDATQGQVSIDDINVKKIQRSSLAKIIGYVSQETYLFHASVGKNLKYGNPAATQEQMESAAKAAYIHDRILEFEQGYDTIVGERGYRLSGGERQRLSIARVLLHDPKILILDEATSSLDTYSERLVQTALEPLMKNRTTIAIAHRLSTILAADVIYTIDNGKVIESGTHSELLFNRGLYSELFEEQFYSGRIESRCRDGIVLSDGSIVNTTDV